MPSYKRPGVYVNEFLKANNAVETGSTTDAIFIGAHHQGPTDEPVYVTSWTQFSQVFGGFPPAGTAVTELPYAVFNYFSSGGRGLYVIRVTGTGSATATTTLPDRAGTPLSTLRIDALSPGAWGNDIRIDVVDRDISNGRFDLVVYSGGTTAPYVVERWLDLSMTDNDSRYVESVINSATAGSAFISVTDLDSASGSPSDAPAATSGAALTSGANGTAPGTTEYTAAVTAGTSLMDTIEGIATVYMPGITTLAVVNALTAYAEERGTFFVVIDTASGLGPAGAGTYVGTLTTSSYGAVYYPHLLVSDPNSTASGATRLCPPGAFVCGKIAETDTSRGVWKAPAGLDARLAGVVAVERRFSTTDLDTLNDGHINVIRQVPGAGIVVMGARTLETSTSDKYINVRRTLNYIKDAVSRSTGFAIFENNDEALWAQLTSVASRFLSQVHGSGGLKGASPDQAFYVKCDSDLNTPAVIASGEVRMEVGVALQHPAEFIVIKIGQWEGGRAASEA